MSVVELCAALLDLTDVQLPEISNAKVNRTLPLPEPVRIPPSRVEQVRSGSAEESQLLRKMLSILRSEEIYDRWLWTVSFHEAQLVLLNFD